MCFCVSGKKRKEMSKIKEMDAVDDIEVKLEVKEEQTMKRLQKAIYAISFNIFVSCFYFYFC